ncbi:MAG: hypothetical protein JKY16_05805 [Lutibacter sp.]|nr:hypothetical protein [Lutibacter sp.]
MRNIRYYILAFLILFVTFSYSQISPGDLTNAHAEFEGISNCTLCHDLGNKVTNNLCLDCHKDIQSLITQERGYHISDDVKDKDCFQCHNEHHGRKFEMIRFDKDKFNHDLTGYILENKHEEIDCKKCHVSDYIADKDLKKRPNTFLGLDTKCAACHDDYHQKTLSSNNCKACHTTKEFAPATKFDHNEADFKLKGKHETVDCKECHELSTKNGKEFQQFNNIAFNDCKNCHDDPHNYQIKASCSQCHTDKSFSIFTGRGKFNHKTTNFTLKGSHKKIDCFSCHEKTSNPTLVFQNKVNVNENNCIECHSDIHENKFGNQCVKCHNETSFILLNSIDFFDHNITDFPLEGLHTKVDCKQCHKGRYTEVINFSACNNCHEDYHEGEFKKNEAFPDCIQCHSLEKGFDTSLFGIESHKNTLFPLDGAHIATPCFACHVSETDDKWRFKDKGTACIECHDDIHEEYITETFYPKNDCTTCHVNETWEAVTFNHTKTNWPLEGKHLETDCRSCHIKDNTSENPFNQKFANLNNDCSSCHKDNHNNQFAVKGVTDCKRCHIFDSWAPEKFDHNTTDFRLEGRHAEIECSACHIAATDPKNSNYNYKIIKHQCIDCHQ